MKDMKNIKSVKSVKSVKSGSHLQIRKFLEYVFNDEDAYCTLFDSLMEEGKTTLANKLLKLQDRITITESTDAKKAFDELEYFLEQA